MKSKRKEFHTSQDKVPSGNSYGSGIKNKTGKKRQEKKPAKKPPRALA